MNRILLLLIATSSCASLMGMEKNLLPAPPAYTAASNATESQGVHAPQMSNPSSLAQIIALSRKLEGKEQQGAFPCCQKISGEADCSDHLLCCAGPLVLGSMTMAFDTILTPCVCYYRTKEPHSSAGRNHYCYVTRQITADLTGIRKIHIQGLNPIYASYLIRCRIPAWNKTTIDND